MTNLQNANRLGRNARFRKEIKGAVFKREISAAQGDLVAHEICWVRNLWRLSTGIGRNMARLFWLGYASRIRAAIFA
jgi:hypothetical protein